MAISGLCHAVDDAPDLIWDYPVQGKKLVGTPVEFIKVDTEKTCQYACKMQRFRSGCDAYNFRSQSNTMFHDCEMFNKSSIVASELENRTHVRFVQGTCEPMDDCLCSNMLCERYGDVCLSKGVGKPSKCLSCFLFYDWLKESNSTVMAELCKKLGLYLVGRKVFLLVNELKTWGEARKFCKSLGGNLPSISSDEEKIFLGRHLPTTKVPWLSVIGHWKLDGTDPDITLHGDAKYDRIDGHKSLFLDGQGSYAIAPAFDLPRDLTIACWLRVIDLRWNENHILSDWSDPHKFRFALVKTPFEGVSFAIRNKEGNDIALAYVPFSVPRLKWFHVILTWHFESGKLKLFINGNLTANVTSFIDVDMSYMVNDHKTHDIGRKGDGMDQTFHGHLRDLALFGTVLTSKEITKIYDGDFSQDGIWVGASDIISEGNFVGNDGLEVNFTYWDPSYSKTGHDLEDCAVMENLKIRDISCGVQMKFACEIYCNLSRSLGGIYGGRLPDSSFTASSAYDHLYVAKEGRLYSKSRGWAPKTTNFPTEYLQVDLGKNYMVSSVATQGCVYHSNEWVAKFMISFSTDKTNWERMQEDGVDKTFIGNTDANSVVRQIFAQPIKARHVRFIPTAYNTYPVFRVDLFGCDNLPPTLLDSP